MTQREECNDSRSYLSRRGILKAGLATGLAAATAPASSAGKDLDASPKPAWVSQPFELDEITISDLQQRLSSGALTARSITEKYLARIEAVDHHGPTLRSVIEVNPDALGMADALDKERREKGTRGPLHGIPILIKDNIDTADRMATTAGSLSLVGPSPPTDASLVQKLRRAGVVLLGKTNLSEWANIRSSHSISGWSGKGGLTKNPFALDRNTSGSSSGSAVAVSANLCAAAVGTETDGSVVSPSSVNGIVGIKPTVGLISRVGVIPISHTQDTAGPMARTLRDAGLLLSALAGADPEDTTTMGNERRVFSDYTKFLDPNGLQGMRIGVVRKLSGFHEGVDVLMNEALEGMKRHGATLIDPADIGTVEMFRESEETVLLYELKADLNAYLVRRGSGAPVHTLKEIIEFNERNRKTEMPYFGQDLFLKAEMKGPLTEKEYLNARAKNLRLARSETIDSVMDQLKLDALVAPTEGPAWMTDLVDGDHYLGGSSTPAAVAGYPSITVPAGFVFGLPVGISFFGRAWSEPVLLRAAYAFEQATKHRRPPQFLKTINAESV